MNWKKHLDEMKAELLLKASVIPGWGFNQEITYIKGKSRILSLVSSKS